MGALEVGEYTNDPNLAARLSRPALDTNRRRSDLEGIGGGGLLTDDRVKIKPFRFPPRTNASVDHSAKLGKPLRLGDLADRLPARVRARALETLTRVLDRSPSRWPARDVVKKIRRCIRHEQQQQQQHQRRRQRCNSDFDGKRYIYYILICKL